MKNTSQGSIEQEYLSKYVKNLIFEMFDKNKSFSTEFENWIS